MHMDVGMRATTLFKCVAIVLMLNEHDRLTISSWINSFVNFLRVILCRLKSKPIVHLSAASSAHMHASYISQMGMNEYIVYTIHSSTSHKG